MGLHQIEDILDYQENCACGCGASHVKFCWLNSEWELLCEFCGKSTANNPCASCGDKMMCFKKVNNLNEVNNES